MIVCLTSKDIWDEIISKFYNKSSKQFTLDMGIGLPYETDEHSISVISS